MYFRKDGFFAIFAFVFYCIVLIGLAKCVESMTISEKLQQENKLNENSQLVSVVPYSGVNDINQNWNKYRDERKC